MRTVKSLPLPLMVVVSLLLVSCGDEDVEGVNQVECMAGETVHPITGQCIAGGSGGEGWNEDGDGTADGGSGDGTADGGSGDGDGGGGDGTADGGSGDGTADGGSEDGDGGGGDGSGDGDPVCGFGTVMGQACSPDEMTLPGANITISGVDCEGNSFELSTQADFSGDFTIDQVPAGNHELVVSLGSFSGQQVVGVAPDDVTDLTAAGKKACIDGGGVPIAVVGGQWDNVGQLLQSLQIEYDTKGNDALGASQAISFLEDYDAMLQYQILFIECGSLWGMIDDPLGGLFGLGGDVDAVKQNLRNFVESGRSLYASDQSYQFVREVFPEAMHFHTNTPTVGVGSQYVTANVVSAEMLNLLGVNTAELYFNLNQWTVLQEAGTGAVSHFRGDAEVVSGDSTTMVTDVPFLVSYTDPVGEGKVIYTSFHNSEQGNMGGDMEEVLRYLIFQL